MSRPESPLIDVAGLQAQLGNEDFVVVDCRFNLVEPAAGHAAWKSGHIPSAVYAHLDDDLARPTDSGEGRHPLPDASAFAATLGRLGIGPDVSVVAYDDQGGAIAARLWWMLGWIGHRNRFLLDGGLAAWQAAELPLEAGETLRNPVDYGPVSADESLVASTAEISERIAAAASAGAVLLDARTPERFRGEVEPIDPVAGHVPGARNLPFSEMLDAAGCFRPADTLREVFAGHAEDGEVIAMCGSGVTGCHLLAGLAAAGRSGRLYVGSWSEWIADPSRKVATGT